MSDFIPLVGIDLGTTFSAIAYIDDQGKPIMIPNQESRPITPSVVYFYDKDNYIVGDEAVNYRLAIPEHTVSFIKVSMGDKDFFRTIHGQKYTPQEISALILKKLKRDAEKYFKHEGLDVEVKDAVITVPAYFGMEQRGATKEAGEMAGLNVLRIQNEPSSAALAFGLNHLGKDNTIFVFDLGGGTFDVTILEIKGNNINMIATDGDPKLGGKDWDDKLVDYCSEIFKEKHGIDPNDDSTSYQELYERVVKAKVSLSKLPKVKIQVSHEGKKEIVEVSREKFEELSIDLLKQCERYVNHVLKKANKRWDDIGILLLVGGSTYMPMVRNMLKKISGKEPSTEVNPDHCVALGAAIEAKLLYVDNIFKSKGGKGVTKPELLGGLPDIIVRENVAKSLGLVVMPDKDGKEISEIIPEQSEIPCTIERDNFTYAYDNQTAISTEITEGKGKTKDEVSIVGDILLDKLPPRPQGAPIKVKFTYNKDKTLDIEVVDVETGLKCESKIILSGSMDDDAKIQAIKKIDSLQQK